jgi:hypothetical protein
MNQAKRLNYSILLSTSSRIITLLGLEAEVLQAQHATLWVLHEEMNGVEKLIRTERD